MVNQVDNNLTDSSNNDVWQLTALSDALGDLTLSVDDSLSVGRGQDNDVVLGSKEVSRNHAVLSVLNGQLYLKDLGSSNGTFVNAVRIDSNQSKQLKADDSVGFASFEFSVIAPQEPNVQEAKISDSETITPVTEQPSEVVSEKGDTSAPVTTKEAVETLPQETKAPVEKQTIIDEVLTEAESANAKSQPKPTATEAITPEPTVSEPATPKAPVTEPTPSETMASEPIKPDPVETAAAKSEPTAPLADEPVSDEPLMHKQAAHTEEVVSPAHDKTTKTALQEEADPEVLRAKQAATAQFSGTANLGKDRDLGTEGNNAMDQAITEAERQQHPDKKPSGSWFIWIFVAIIIIALALWLFNMGGAA